MLFSSGCQQLHQQALPEQVKKLASPINTSYLEQVKHVASPESCGKVNILQDEPATSLGAVTECLPDLRQMTLIFRSECNGSHPSFHANLLGQLLHLVDGVLEQLACPTSQHTHTHTHVHRINCRSLCKPGQADSSWTLLLHLKENLQRLLVQVSLQAECPFCRQNKQN